MYIFCNDFLGYIDFYNFLNYTHFYALFTCIRILTIFLFALKKSFFKDSFTKKPDNKCVKMVTIFLRKNYTNFLYECGVFDEG